MSFDKKLWMRGWRRRNSKRLLKQMQDYRKSHRDEVKEWGRRNEKKRAKRSRPIYAKQYRLLHLQKHNEWSKEDRNKLSNSYVRSLFFQLCGIREVPEKLLQAKRAHIKVLRLLRRRHESRV